MPLARPIRQRCDLAARLELNGASHPVRVLDLTEAGAFVESELDLQYGDAGWLRIDLAEGETCSCHVTVVRLGRSQREIHHPQVEHVAVTRPGAGLRFDAVPPDDAARLARLVARLEEG